MAEKDFHISEKYNFRHALNECYLYAKAVLAGNDPQRAAFLFFFPTFAPVKHYPGKLLLFGEHVLLIGAPALATPVPAFSGYWKQISGQRCPQPIPADFTRSEGLLKAGINVDLFEADLQSGWCFESNIPIGYGLGSSGALCAAVYDRYARHKEADLGRLKTIFSGMESWFHGQSSGIDPLTSYLNRPLRIDRQTEVGFFEGAAWRADAPVVFLLDSGLPRQTGPLVRWFLEQQQTEAFGSMLNTIYLPAHSRLLDSWKSADPAAFWSAIKTISRLQLAHFHPMIPATLREIWTASLDNPDVALKICGAGGGGFTLGFARTRAAAIETAASYRILFPFENPTAHENRST